MPPPQLRDALSWLARDRGVELRKARDGHWYSWREFLQHYGYWLGRRRWHEAWGDGWALAFPTFQ